ncbi:MAG: 4Fe-4S binding protein [Chloroflexota bacterium]
MPKKTVVIDYHDCNPQLCQDGICKVMLACERKVVTQQAPYELPDARSSMCLGCSLCMNVCPAGAIRML